MQLNQSTDYAIRLILYLAKAAHTVPSSKLSKAIGVSSRYLLQIGAKLRDAGFITVSHGSNGGYTLSKSPEEITLLEIINLMERRPHFYYPTSVQTERISHALDATYKHINDILIDALGSVTIQSLLTKSDEESK